ncbi:uncharacterized protein C8A04DRAFT_32329 [Dichotomopilus funicola]|uniref:Uncharacterized protein n=1 Tax=Dichotomopilus funicola TaxID=1934379 RepID=A0AAN6ZIX1_9PEZI|nr:hypothetical protein C8A04DRAFT_32329 [Dichotomopilus funicola]
MRFARHPKILTESDRRRYVAGTYVDSDDARTICKSFHIPAAVVDQLETEAAAAAAAAATAPAVTSGGGHAL